MTDQSVPEETRPQETGHEGTRPQETGHRESGRPDSTQHSAAELQQGVGQADGWARLWTPHRLSYVQRESKPAGSATGDCPFCTIPRLSDADGLIVARGQQVFAVLNLYPYNPGHLMVVPYRHVADYPDLTSTETSELASFTQTAMGVVRSVSGPHGFNIGMNQGQVAGAGIAAHLHQHLVPRWGGDANFMPVVAQTKVLPQLLGQTRQMIAAAWPN